MATTKTSPDQTTAPVKTPKAAPAAAAKPAKAVNTPKAPKALKAAPAPAAKAPKADKAVAPTPKAPKPAKPAKAPKADKLAALDKLEQFYEGKAKKLYTTRDPHLVIQYFKDDATAFNAQKRGTILNKGIINNTVSSRIFDLLDKKGVPTHFVKRLTARDMLVKRLSIIPVEVVVRNVVAGSLSKRTGLEEGVVLKHPIIELYYKNDALGDPLVNDDHILVFGWADKKQLKKIRELATKVNGILVPFFKKLGIRLIDYKLEFGMHKGKLVLGDEITPDGCRLWDAETNEKLDKDRFRRDLGQIEEAYIEVAKRVLGKHYAALEKDLAAAAAAGE